MLPSGLLASNQSCCELQIMYDFWLLGKQPSCTSRQKGFKQKRSQFAARVSLDKK